MKKLSKVLTLILALAMVLGLMTVGASAAFSDSADITYTTAVDMLTGLGVINGIPGANGVNSFDPKGNFDRGGLAKMVAYFTWGGTDKSNLYSGAKVFNDLAGYEWAAGAINYGKNAGYINGITANTYDPDGTVTGSMLAKTLLVVMGYKANSEDPAYALVGGDWELNSIRLAEAEGLFANLKAGFDPTKALTREEAAQIFYNLLQKGYTYTAYNKDNTPIVAAGSLGAAPMDKYFSNWTLKNDATTDNYGRPAKAYQKNATDTVLKVVASPVKSYMSFAAADLAALTAAGYTFNGTSFVVNNGTLVGVSTMADLAGRAYVGNAIELYAENAAQPKNITKVVMVQEYLTKVTGVVSSNVNATANYIDLAVYNPWHASDVVNVRFYDTASTVVPSVYDGLVAKYAKDSYLMTAWRWGDVVADDYHWIEASDVTTEVANVTSTKLDASFSGTFVASGKTYTMASGYAELAGIGGALTLGKDYTIYKDANGYVVGAALVNPAPAAVNYGIVLDYQYEDGTPANNMTGAPAAAAFENVKLFTAAGKVEILGTAFVLNANGYTIDTLKGTGLSEGDNGVLVAYTLDANGKIASLTKAAGVAGLDGAHTKGNTFEVVAGDAKDYATDKTVTFVCKNGTLTGLNDIVVYTGYATVPAATYTAGAAVAAAPGAAGALNVTVATLPETTTLAQYVVLTDTVPSVSAGATAGTNKYTWNAILNGQATTVFANAASDSFSTNAGKLCTVTFDATTGAIATLVPVVADIDEVKTVAAGYYADDAVVYTDAETVYYKLSGTITEGAITGITGFAAAEMTVPGNGDTYKTYEYKVDIGLGSKADVVFFFVYQP